MRKISKSFERAVTRSPKVQRILGRMPKQLLIIGWGINLAVAMLIVVTFIIIYLLNN
jgi:hypothetical protein